MPIEKKRKQEEEELEDEPYEESSSSGVIKTDNNKNNSNNKKKSFSAVSALEANQGKSEYRKIRCPPNRLTPLRSQWDSIMTPIVEYLKLQIRFNPKTRFIYYYFVCYVVVLFIISLIS